MAKTSHYLARQVESMVQENIDMKCALAAIARIAHYHRPISNAAADEIESIATKAVQGEKK